MFAEERLRDAGSGSAPRVRVLRRNGWLRLAALRIPSRRTIPLREGRPRLSSPASATLRSLSARVPGSPSASRSWNTLPHHLEEAAPAALVQKDSLAPLPGRQDMVERASLPAADCCGPCRPGMAAWPMPVRRCAMPALLLPFSPPVKPSARRTNSHWRPLTDHPADW